MLRDGADILPLTAGLCSQMHCRYVRRDACGRSRARSAAPRMPNAREVLISALLWIVLTRRALGVLEEQLPAVVELLKRLS